MICTFCQGQGAIALGPDFFDTGDAMFLSSAQDNAEPCKHCDATGQVAEETVHGN